MILDTFPGDFTYFRRIAVFLRFDDFKQRISYDVVFFHGFGDIAVNDYYCLPTMQVLTGQYTKMYTHKLRLFYTDFQPEATNVKTISLLNLGRTDEIISTKIWVKTAFRGATAPVSTLAIYDTATLAYTFNQAHSYCMSACHYTLGSTFGNVNWTNNRPTTGGATAGAIIGDMTNAYTIYAQLAQATGAVINNLTQGEAEIWLTTAKRP